MSLRNKIFGAFLIFISITFIPLIYIMQYRIKPMNQSDAQYHTMQLIDSKAQEIGSWLNQRISEMRIIHEYPPCRILDFSRIKPYLTNLNYVLKENYGNNEETFAIGGLDGKGWINDDITIDVSTREYFKEAILRDNEYIISEPLVSKSNSDPIFLICYPIRGGSGEKVGFINGAVNLKLMARITDNIDIYDGFSWIMNREGDVYTASDEAFNKNNVTPEVLATISSQAIQESGLLDMRNITGADYTTFYSSVPYAPDWILCTMIDNSKINGMSNHIINLLLTISAILIVITASFALLISRSITRPVERLKYHMLQVSEGNLDSVYMGKGSDEISVLGSVFNQMLSAIKDLVYKVLKTQEQKRRAELKALQSQITPHFLYNTLDTIQWKALSYNAYEVADMIQLLSRFFRISLSGGKEYITIEDEICHVTSYLQIQEIRYKDKIIYNIVADEDASHHMIPKLIIQPLIENSIYHGIKPKDSLGRIDIKIEAIEGYLNISVKDDGVGMTPERLCEVRDNLSKSAEWSHYGLYNVNERLRLTYGDSYSIQIQSLLHKGTEIIIRIPIESRNKNA